MDWLGDWDIVDGHPAHCLGGDPMTERKEATVSQIKQYGARGPLSDPPILGEYIMVTYADHLAALRACEQRVSGEFLTSAALAVTGMSDPRYAKGYTDALDAAREVVEEMDLHGCHPYRFPDCNCLGPQVIAAIDALRKEN